MKRTFLLVLLALAFFATTDSWGAPAINSVTGIVRDKNSITISGSGFGSKLQAAPQLWDTVSNQYSGLGNGSAVPTGSGQPWGNMEGTVVYSTSNLRGVDKANYYGTGNAADLQHFIEPTPTNQFYVSWWFYVSSSWNPSGGGATSNKLLRCSESSNYVNNTYSMSDAGPPPADYVFENPNYCQKSADGSVENWWQSNPVVPGTWNRAEVWFDSSKQTFQSSINNVPTSSSPVSWSNGCAPFNFDEVWKIGWESNGTLSNSIYFGDIYVDNTLERVEVCDAPTWSARSHCEIQIPTAWSNGSATVTINQGSFASNATAYLYVVDATNTANSQGYPITLGNGSSLSAPTNLHLIQ
jgi:hypothetical protein